MRQEFFFVIILGMMDERYQIDEPKKGKIKIITLTLALAAVLLAAFLVYFFTQVNQPTSSVSSPVSLSIDKGMSARQVATRLAEKQLVNYSWIFTLYIYVQGAGNKIQAGEYLLDRRMSLAEVTQIVTAGKVVSNEHRITILEGWSNKQIGKYLESRNIFTAGQFEEAADSHEGYLFPDTYLLSKQATASELVEKMLANFENKTKDLAITKDIIIMASIVEKEVGRTGPDLTDKDLTGMEQERRFVASVFYNRLKLGMPLQSDATVNYITGKSDRQVSLADAKIKSPYNTYLVKGLPPGPIGNPGLDAIKASIEPAESDYLYFLNAPDGTAYFAKTIEEHNANRAKYLE
ncbi:MAG: endolytic transglycosylase MltG [Candidatus Doudnabacteria bacterium]|nr:endolytic transglycosylase MltG [Candidatus Doudnabacteria bacterium]